MPFNRQLYRQLEAWKTSNNRKPLILRGARQVGKTTLIHQFSKSFQHYIALNLEHKSDIRFFDDYEDIKTIKEALFFEHNIPNDATNTLLFIDEIQASPKAIQLLRYFYEELPDLYVIAAGSLLEFAMKEVNSFPVGRVEYLYLHPLNFSEFLLATNQQNAYEQLQQIPISNYAHKTMIHLFNTYTIIGGMPEIIKTYLEQNSIIDLPKIYESIWATYQNDVEKYASNKTERNVIKHIINVAPLYIDQRVKFQHFGNSNYKSREVGEAFYNLDAANIVQLIYPTTDIESPIKSDLKKSPKIQLLDTGLLNYTLQIQTELLAYDDLSNSFKGAIIPHIITQELISLNTINNPKPNFWVRDKAQSSAEVDLVFNYKNTIIPIEIKSGKTGSLKSLHEFIERCPHHYAIRIYAGAFNIETHTTPNQKKTYKLLNLPYYLGTKIQQYIAYFLQHH